MPREAQETEGTSHNSPPTLLSSPPHCSHLSASPPLPLLCSSAPPRPPSRRPLTLVDKCIASIQSRWVAGVQNLGRDQASALRVLSPIRCRPRRGPANAVLSVPALPPVPDLVVLGSAPAPSTEPAFLGTPLDRGFS
ncbi:hypothetical protein ZWY2020_033322 [Hordeum vulgare]|nr:hypothetical protein ZWY2020_033322 [Hordeum vulgare]